MTQAEALKAEARRLGLDSIGITSAWPFEAEERLLRNRPPHPFETGDAATRTHPARFFPGARSVVVVTMSYLMDDEPPGSPGLHGSLSRYCRGEDYHALLEDRLGRLARWLEAQTPCHTLVHVDTGAPLERPLAVRAGLGRMGKNTNVIAPHLGSWIFLGELYTDLELAPDEPLTGSICGSCTLCLEACPTQCLTDWHLEATRCLGSVNQVDGMIPDEFRIPLGTRLFGCDDCQDVCPHNISARRGLHPEFAPRAPMGAGPDLEALIGMTEEQFQAWFAPTAAAWRGRVTLQRNAAVALGNCGDPAALPVLQHAVRHSEAVVRAHAAWSLGRLAGQVPAVEPAARETLRQCLGHEPDASVRGELESALEMLCPG